MEENRNFGPTRGSIISVINEVWKILVVVLGAILGYLFLGNKEIMQQKYFIIILLIIKPFVKLAIYFSTTYEVKNKSFLVKSGIFTRKILEIPLEVITTVDFGQSLFYQIFQCYKVKIDNASQNVAKKDESEILVSLAKKDALYLKELLTGKSLEHSENLKERKKQIQNIETKVTDTILFGLFSSSILNVIQVLIVLVPILSVASNLFAGVKDEFQLYEMVFQWVSVANVAQIALVIVLVLVVNFVYVVFISLLRYYPFQVQFSENEINIEYGTISKKSYTFNRKKISGIKRKQTILMRMFGYETLELLVVGYGDQSQEDKVQEVPLLIPIIKVKKGDKILTQLFKDYEEEKEIFDADKRGFPYFFLTFRMFFGVALMGSSLFVSQLSNVRILSLLLLGIIVLSVWMEYKSTKIFMGDRYITVVSGSFKLEKKVLPWNKIESLAGVGSVWKQKRGLVTILFSANAPLTESKLTSKNMDKNTLEKIIERIPI